MGKVTITLDAMDAGQVLDGLRIRAEAYRSTEGFFKAEAAGRDWEGPLEEVNDAHEASRIAESYERIISEIEAQL